MYIKIEKDIELKDKLIDRKVLEEIFEKGGKYPAIKEQLVLKAHEITTKTKLIYECEEVSVFLGEDKTGHYLSCFNKTSEEVILELPLEVLQLNHPQNAYCVLTATELAVVDDKLVLNIPDEGILLVKLTDE